MQHVDVAVAAGEPRWSGDSGFVRVHVRWRSHSVKQPVYTAEYMVSLRRDGSTWKAFGARTLSIT
jgi:hypothetical protein